MSYDDLDRLTLADSAAQPPLRSPWGYSWGLATFSYDGQDNLRSFQMGAADFSYAYDSQGRLQNVSQAGEPLPLFSYTHNARGQMTSRKRGPETGSGSLPTATRAELLRHRQRCAHVAS